MTLYTSYFARCKSGDKRLSICRRPPDWYTGRRCFILAPDENLLGDYKAGRVTKEQFAKAYIARLDALGIDGVLAELNDGDILLCWEAKGKFCHRHILAEWLKAYGHTVIELE